jgi:hypothetical protein
MKKYMRICAHLEHNSEQTTKKTCIQYLLLLECIHGRASVWLRLDLDSCYITSARTARENTNQLRIKGNVYHSAMVYFQESYLHGNVFAEPLLNSGWFLDCSWELACRRYVVARRRANQWALKLPWSRWWASACGWLPQYLSEQKM